MRYAVVIEPAGSGYSAYVPDLPGCVAATGSYEETLALIREAIPLHIEVMRQHGEVVPEPITRCDYAEIVAA